MLYIFYLSLLSFFYHPIYISVLEIDSIDNDLQLIVKIFRDDLEDGIRYTLKKEVSIDNQNKNELNKTSIENYLKSVLKVGINNQKKSIFFSEFILENDRVKVSGKINNNSKIKILEINNEILIDVYPIQNNVVLVKIYDQIFSLNLGKENKISKLIVE